MFIFGFILNDPYLQWSDDPFDDSGLHSEDVIDSAAHIYYDLDGNKCIGFDMSLGMSQDDMTVLLSAFAYPDELEVREVIE